MLMLYIIGKQINAKSHIHTNVQIFMEVCTSIYTLTSYIFQDVAFTVYSYICMYVAMYIKYIHAYVCVCSYVATHIATDYVYKQLVFTKVSICKKHLRCFLSVQCLQINLLSASSTSKSVKVERQCSKSV